MRSPSKNLPFFVGAFLSAVFVFTGICGTWFTGPVLLKWWESAHWPTAPGEILTGELRYTNSPRGGATVRPHFTWIYEAGGRSHRGEGYGFADVSTSSVRNAAAALKAFPPGKKVAVMVNPADPADSALVRDTPGKLVVLILPPLFFCLGLVGAFFTATGRLCWYAKGTRNPVGKAGRAFVAFLIRPKAIIAILAVGMTAAFAALIAYTARTGNAAGIIVAVFLAWALFRVWKTVKARR